MTAANATRPSSPVRSIFAAVLGLIGLILIAGGAILLFGHGGSPYYLLAGLATAASGVFVWRGSRTGARIYGAMLIGTIAWALWEAGLDGWALAPRLIGPFLLGLGFCLPAIRRGTPVADGTPKWWRGWRGFAIGSVAAAVIGIGLFHATGGDPLDPMYQTGTTDLIAGGGGAPDDVSGDAWHHWGNNPGGQRYSPLDQLTPANVAGLERAWTVNVGGVVGNYVEKLQATPLKVGDALFLCTGYNDILSIDAETGHLN